MHLGAATTDFYAQVSSHDEMGQEILDNTLNNNDQPPYSRDHMPGGPLQPFLELADIAIMNDFGDASAFSTYSTGPMVPALGLINLGYGVISDPGATISIEIDLVPGKYKGILADRGL